MQPPHCSGHVYQIVRSNCGTHSNCVLNSLKCNRICVHRGTIENINMHIRTHTETFIENLAEHKIKLMFRDILLYKCALVQKVKITRRTHTHTLTCRDNHI